MRIYALFGVLFAGLNNVAVYQNIQIWGMTIITAMTVNNINSTNAIINIILSWPQSPSTDISHQHIHQNNWNEKSSSNSLKMNPHSRAASIQFIGFPGKKIRTCWSLLSKRLQISSSPPTKDLFFHKMIIKWSWIILTFGDMYRGTLVFIRLSSV